MAIRIEFKKIDTRIPKFIFLTDGWHLFKSAMLWCVGFAFADLLSAQYDLYKPYFDFWIFAIISRALIGLTFVLYYSIILKIKR